MQNRILTELDALQYLKIEKLKLRSLMLQGKIPYTKNKNGFFFKQEDIDKYLNTDIVIFESKINHEKR